MGQASDRRRGVARRLDTRWSLRLILHLSVGWTALNTNEDNAANRVQAASSDRSESYASYAREPEKGEFAVSAVNWFTVARYGSARAVAAVRATLEVPALTLAGTAIDNLNCDGISQLRVRTENDNLDTIRPRHRHNERQGYRRIGGEDYTCGSKASAASATVVPAPSRRAVRVCRPGRQRRSNFIPDFSWRGRPLQRGLNYTCLTHGYGKGDITQWTQTAIAR